MRVAFVCAVVVRLVRVGLVLCFVVECVFNKDGLERVVMRIAFVCEIVV